MKAETFHNALLNAIKERMNEGENMANTLMDILFLGKEAVYRRLRGEVPFTLMEAGTISKALGISLDSLVGIDTGRSRPFKMNLVEYDNLTEVDYAMLQNYLDILSMSRDDPYSEITVSANAFPQPFFYRYSLLSRFFLFKWTYHHGRGGGVKPLSEIIIPDRLHAIQQESISGHMNMKTSCYIFDNLISLYLINDIKYFTSIRLVTEQEKKILKKELLDLLDYLEFLATTAKYENGNNVYFYVSNINFESTYTYLRVHNARISFIDIFVLNGAASIDEGIYEHVKTWVQSLRRLSTLISQSGELQRIKFFKEQREVVNSL